MCGIAGVLCFDGFTDGGALIEMTRKVLYRGPDGEGFLFCDPDGLSINYEPDEIDKWRNRPFRTGLGHRRLAVLDLSPAGRQPMGTPDNLLWLVHNGEIYNYLELRAELRKKGYRFVTLTDTEVILYAYREWGVDCLKKFNGMWSFALLDLSQRKLFCARDRAGVKPFYYFWNKNRFAFASEIKQLLIIPEAQFAVNTGVLYDYLIYGLQDHSRETFWKGIYSLPGGHYLCLSIDDSEQAIKLHSYWEPDLNQRSNQKKEDFAEKFLELFKDSIKLRLRSDVPVGSCLSGGLDSSGIVCLLKQIKEENALPVEQLTFSSCFEDLRWDERKYISDVVEKTGARAVYVFPSAQELCGLINKITCHQDGPFGSTSIFAQWKVFEGAHQHGVTVMLDGQGADELLAGYYPYFVSFWWELLKKGQWFKLAGELSWFFYNYSRKTKEIVQGALKSKLFNALLSKNFNHNLINWANPEFIFAGKEKSPYGKYLLHRNNFHKDTGKLGVKLYEDFRITGLPALLHYEDRNSMAFSIEARLPFLDYRLVEFLFTLPSEHKISKGITKVVYRQALRDYLPSSIITRKDKMGFVTPEEIWIKNELRPLMEETFNLVPKGDSYFSKQGLLKTFDDVVKGRKPFGFLPWRLFHAVYWLQMLTGREDRS